MNKRSIVVLVLVPFVLSQVFCSVARSKSLSGAGESLDFVKQSDLIVLATVESVEVDPTEVNPMESSIEQDRVVLRVIDTWKGPFLREVTVTSYPEQYTVGDHVVAFLEQGESRAQRWREAIEGIGVTRRPRTWTPKSKATRRPWTNGRQRIRRRRWRGSRPSPSGREDAGSRSITNRHPRTKGGRGFPATCRERRSASVRRTIDHAARLDWLVSAAARRSTRSYGLDELRGVASGSPPRAKSVRRSS
jgi:hypothetical protein